MQNNIRGAPIFAQHMPARVIERGTERVVSEIEFTDPYLNATGTL